MKDKRQRHSLSWPYSLDQNLCTLMVSQAVTGLPYPLLPHIPFQLFSPLSMGGVPPFNNLSSPYRAACIRPLDTMHLPHSPYTRLNGIPPSVLYPPVPAMQHPPACPCSFCLQWSAPDYFNKARQTDSPGLSLAGSSSATGTQKSTLSSLKTVPF